MWIINNWPEGSQKACHRLNVTDDPPHPAFGPWLTGLVTLVKQRQGHWLTLTAVTPSVGLYINSNLTVMLPPCQTRSLKINTGTPNERCSFPPTITFISETENALVRLIILQGSTSGFTLKRRQQIAIKAMDYTLLCQTKNRSTGLNYLRQTQKGNCEEWSTEAHSDSLLNTTKNSTFIQYSMNAN